LVIAANIAFYVVFSVFIVLILGLTVITVRWAVLRDRLARRTKNEPNADGEPLEPPAVAKDDGRGEPEETTRA
jgi:hypothetical protein